MRNLDLTWQGWKSPTTEPFWDVPSSSVPGASGTGQAVRDAKAQMAGQGISGFRFSMSTPEVKKKACVNGIWTCNSKPHLFGFSAMLTDVMTVQPPHLNYPKLLCGDWTEESSQKWSGLRLPRQVEMRSKAIGWLMGKRREFRGANIFVLRNDDQKHAFMMHKHVAFAL